MRVIFCFILTCTFPLIFNLQIELVSVIIKSLDINVGVMKTVVEIATEKALNSE